MCIMSMFIDYGRQHIWPTLPTYTYPSVPPMYVPLAIPTAPTAPPSVSEADIEKFCKFMELIQKAKGLDAAANQPDCEDPEKAKWLQQLTERIEALEKKLAAISDATR